MKTFLVTLLFAAVSIARADMMIHFSGTWSATAAGFQAGDAFTGEASWNEPGAAFTGTVPLLSADVPTFPVSSFSGLPWSSGALYISGHFASIEWHGNIGSVPIAERSTACAPDGTGPTDLMVMLMPTQAMGACVNGSPHNYVTAAMDYQFSMGPTLEAAVIATPEPRYGALMLICAYGFLMSVKRSGWIK